MRLNQIRPMLRKIWLFACARTVQYFGVTSMMLSAYSRSYEEYPWKVTETIRFQCLSMLSGLYLVEHSITKQNRMPDGQLKTEVESRKEWRATFTSCGNVLTGLGKDWDNVIAFYPEKMKILLEGVDYDVKLSV